MASRVIPVAPFDLVIFGATGDLARRKLLPALYHRDLAQQIPEGARILAVARRDLDSHAYRAIAAAGITAEMPATDRDPDAMARFLARLDYLRIDAASDDGWDRLASALPDGTDRVRAFYMAVAPELFTPICARLAASGAVDAGSRLVVEKPLGSDLESARVLNRQVLDVFHEKRLYRIDHYLGKETVQNLMAVRFANALFEPLWNARHIDHVQITVAEQVGVEGRGAYYDGAGAMRDMVQNHLLQLLCLTAMEPPSHFEPDSVRDEKLKVLRALQPIDARAARDCVVRGQYAGLNGMGSYVEDVGIEASRTETFVALKVAVANWRWSGTPFYLRTGKRLRARVSEIAVVFKDTPHSIFPDEAGAVRRNTLVIRLQPDEGITLRMTIKEPGPGGMRLIEAPLDMTFASSLGIEGLRMPDAYERLIMDVIRGDQTLFMRGDEVEAAWAWVDPIIEAWTDSNEKPHAYDPGGSGPEEALMLLHREGRRWRDLTA